MVLVARGEAEWTQGIRRADAVVLIGGKGGTLGTGKRAPEEGKPVFPLACTGGDADKFYIQLLNKWSKYPIPGLSKEELSRVARPTNAAILGKRSVR